MKQRSFGVRNNSLLQMCRHYNNNLKTVTVSEMQELDRKAMEDIGIPSIVLMENAGRCVGELAMDMLDSIEGKRVAIFCGTGNNGGDGFVTARHLARKKIDVGVYIVGEKSRLKKDPLINLRILENMGIEIKEIFAQIEKIDAHLVIDAIFGIGLKGEIREPVRAIIKDLNNKDIPILSIDVPSGLDADTGKVLGEAIRAAKTAAMQFPKRGFYINKGPEYAGEIVVVDIGI